MKYKLSKDYVALFNFICSGNIAAGFVHPKHNQVCDGDIVGIIRIAPWSIDIGVRGRSFFSMSYFESDFGDSEEEEFVSGCEWIGLEWIDGVDNE